MKTCFKCGKVKAYTEFYKHKAMSDGYFGKCKICTKKDVKQNYEQKFEYYQQYERERSKLPHRKELASTIQRRYRQEHPERRLAHEMVGNAIRDGKLHKDVCWICGKNAEAHHPDYSRPLEVVWLCSKHHKEAHALIK